MTTQMSIEIGADADQEQLETLAHQLREELLEAPVDGVSSPTTDAPPAGTRSLGVTAAGTLLVTLQGTAELVEQVVRLVRSWWRRAPAQRSLTLRMGDHVLELNNATEEQQERLVEQFLAAVAAG